MKAGSAAKLIVDALLQRFLPLARRRIETAQVQENDWQKETIKRCTILFEGFFDRYDNCEPFSYQYITLFITMVSCFFNYAEKEGREPSRLEQFRFQHLRKDGSGKLSSEAAEQVFDEACKMVKDSMPIPESSSAPQDNIALENEVYTQVFGPDKDGKMLGYGRGMTKSRLFGYGSVTRESQSTSAITTLIEEMSAKKEAESRFRMEAAEREAHLVAEAQERFMKLTEIQEAMFMKMMDAHEKKYKALIDECMAKGMSIEFQSSGLDDKAFSSNDDE
ncbi:hypothetical protein J1N35_028423 [Gossypium stocksii]|uniref:Uncharacterized protein n=1 Tax=Gossypium stocksii TaxID=47602 RepID=A0A9D3UVW4_9ROSI|nr:hypothetical protein J1N35_028423 [Gossypium stocksii]